MRKLAVCSHLPVRHREAPGAGQGDRPGPSERGSRADSRRRASMQTFLARPEGAFRETASDLLAVRPGQSFHLSLPPSGKTLAVRCKAGHHPVQGLLPVSSAKPSDGEAAGSGEGEASWCGLLLPENAPNPRFIFARVSADSASAPAPPAQVCWGL